MGRWILLLTLVAAAPATRPTALEEARELARAGEHAHAIEKYHAALATDDSAPARAGLAGSLLALSRVEEARSEIARATNINPKEPGYWMISGRVELADRQWDAAERRYQKAVQAAPARAGEIWADLAAALADQKDESLNGRIEAALKRAATADPPDRDALFTLGQGYAKAGKEEGKVYLQKYLELERALPEDKRDAQKMQLARQMIRAIDILKSIQK